ncbi:UvrD-helicase domain-containing protein [Aquirufa sp. ROCK2-A2]
MTIIKINSLIFISSIIFVFISYFLIQQKKKANLRKLWQERLEKERLERERLRLEAEEAKRLKDKRIIENLFPEVIIANKSFSNYTLYKSGYFNNNKLVFWKQSISDLRKKLNKYNLESLGLDISIITEINQLNRFYENCESIRKKYNKDFIEYELNENDALFANIEGQSLDVQQRTAIVKDEDHNLVIAGAGSGKTTTVAGKVTYVIERFNTNPEDILLITFTKKASDEMKDRIKEKMNIDIEVNTFHSFGRKVIGEVTQNMPSVIEETQSYKELKNIFASLFKDYKYANNVIRFITEFRIETKDVNDFKSHGEYINYLKDNNIRTYKMSEVVINGKKTIMRDYCKSLEEVQIANYLFLNSVNYKYEDPYKYKTADSVYAQYKPDFYLPDYDIYIEHFGLIDRNNNVPHWFSSSNGQSAKEKYNGDIAWKRETHTKHETTLIETFSYENKEGILLENLKEKLENQGVVFKQRTSEEIWKILNSTAKEEVSALDTLISTFLNLFKSNNYIIKNITDQISSYTDEKIKARYYLFLEIFTPVLIKYNEFLKSKNLIDFSDMINDATAFIASNKFKNKFKYIIIDEFQDTSIGRFNLINALLKNNKTCRLFAVGDDWQSIYRFAGSDISLFTQFEKHFGVTEFSKIETTYRFGKSMIDISSKFILTNPNQTVKKLKSIKDDNISPIEIIHSNSFRNDDPFPLIDALNQIDIENFDNDKNLTILALSRYNFVIELYKERSDLFSVYKDQNDNSYTIVYLELPHLEIKFLSVHRAKGLQGDYVILLNCVSGQFGFPSEQSDDPILNLLLSKSDQFTNGEERRLFYVALTRSKRKTFITTNISYKSKFINEIDPNYIEDPISKCPICKLGDRIKREGISKTGRPYIKYSCSNWKFGCDYLAWG